jgi:hypothetical protein
VKDDRYLDLAKYLERHSDQYTDFEGMADVDYVKELLAIVDTSSVADMCRDEEERQAVRTIVTHWIYENMEAGHRPSPTETLDFAWAAQYILGNRYWLKEDAE